MKKKKKNVKRGRKPVEVESKLFSIDIYIGLRLECLVDLYKTNGKIKCFANDYKRL